MKTLVISLCLTIAAGAVYLKAQTNSSAQSNSTFIADHDYLYPVQAKASPACQACRDNCVQRRTNCQFKACSDAGGKNNGARCDNAVHPDQFQAGLQRCYVQEKQCWSQCDATVACR